MSEGHMCFTHSGLQHGQHYYLMASSNAHANHWWSWPSPIFLSPHLLLLGSDNANLIYQPILIIFVTLLFVEHLCSWIYKTLIYTPADTLYWQTFYIFKYSSFYILHKCSTARSLPPSHGIGWYLHCQRQQPQTKGRGWLITDDWHEK